MTLTLKIDPTLEQRLRQHAARRGLEPDSYAVAAIEEQLRRDRFEPPHLSHEESELLQQINLGFDGETWNRYDSLIAKREERTLTATELDELKGLTEQLEKNNLRRIEALVKLARMRNTNLEALMDQLQIKPHERRGG
jgi:hypothetical protein